MAESDNARLRRILIVGENKTRVKCLDSTVKKIMAELAAEEGRTEKRSPAGIIRPQNARIELPLVNYLDPQVWRYDEFLERLENLPVQSETLVTALM